MLNKHTVPLRHLIAAFDGPTSSDKGFTGPVHTEAREVQ